MLGEHVEQKGSLVDPYRTRFDFAHEGALTAEQIAEIERLVNERIYADLPVRAVDLPLAQAKTIPGVRAVFGEKYPDPVRVLMIGPETPDQATADDSVEFCGGTHLSHTGQAGFFKIVSQEAVGKGAPRHRRHRPRGGRRGATAGVGGRGPVRPAQLQARGDCQPRRALQDEIKKLHQQLKKARDRPGRRGGQAARGAEEIAGA